MALQSISGISVNSKDVSVNANNNGVIVCQNIETAAPAGNLMGGISFNTTDPYKSGTYYIRTVGDDDNDSSTGISYHDFAIYKNDGDTKKYTGRNRIIGTNAVSQILIGGEMFNDVRCKVPLSVNIIRPETESGSVRLEGTFEIDGHLQFLQDTNQAIRFRTADADIGNIVIRSTGNANEDLVIGVDRNKNAESAITNTILYADLSATGQEVAETGGAIYIGSVKNGSEEPLYNNVVIRSDRFTPNGNIVFNNHHKGILFPARGADNIISYGLRTGGNASENRTGASDLYLFASRSNNLNDTPDVSNGAILRALPEGTYNGTKRDGRIILGSVLDGNIPQQFKNVEIAPNVTFIVKSISEHNGKSYFNNETYFNGITHFNRDMKLYRYSMLIDCRKPDDADHAWSSHIKYVAPFERATGTYVRNFADILDDRGDTPEDGNKFYYSNGMTFTDETASNVIGGFVMQTYENKGSDKEDPEDNKVHTSTIMYQRIPLDIAKKYEIVSPNAGSSGNIGDQTYANASINIVYNETDAILDSMSTVVPQGDAGGSQIVNARWAKRHLSYGFSGPSLRDTNGYYPGDDGYDPFLAPNRILWYNNEQYNRIFWPENKSIFNKNPPSWAYSGVGESDWEYSRALWLTESFTNFNRLVIVMCNDDSIYQLSTSIWNTYDLHQLMGGGAIETNQDLKDLESFYDKDGNEKRLISRFLGLPVGYSAVDRYDRQTILVSKDGHNFHIYSYRVCSVGDKHNSTPSKFVTSNNSSRILMIVGIGRRDTLDYITPCINF